MARRPRSPEEPSASFGLLHHERLHLQTVGRVAGVDEAGRGPLAGPVVAAALSFDSAGLLDGTFARNYQGLTDSKALSAKRREAFFLRLTQDPAVRLAFAVVDAEEIDGLNILRATHVAMARALADLDPLPDLALVDGLPVPNLPCPSRNLVGGDALSLSIAAASIVAKVTRDRLMAEYDKQYPMYGFARHQGYGTLAHREALRCHGPCPIHRRSFRPVREVCGLEPFPGKD